MFSLRILLCETLRNFVVSFTALLPNVFHFLKTLRNFVLYFVILCGCFLPQCHTMFYTMSHNVFPYKKTLQNFVPDFVPYFAILCDFFNRNVTQCFTQCLAMFSLRILLCETLRNFVVSFTALLPNVFHFLKTLRNFALHFVILCGSFLPQCLAMFYAMSHKVSFLNH